MNYGLNLQQFYTSQAPQTISPLAPVYNIEDGDYSKLNGTGTTDIKKIIPINNQSASPAPSATAKEQLILGMPAKNVYIISGVIAAMLFFKGKK